MSSRVASSRVGAYRVGGLAVALGIGSALLAGQGVAAADPGDGATDPSNTASSSTDGGVGTGTDAEKDSAATVPDDAGDPAESDGSDVEDDADDTDPVDEIDDIDEVDDVDGLDEIEDVPEPRKRAKAAQPDVDPSESTTLAEPDPDPDEPDEVTVEPEETVDEPPAAVAPTETPTPTTTTTTVSSPPAQPDEPAVTETPVEAATIELDKQTSGSGDERPPSPIETAAVWTLAAAARRELAATDDVEPTAQQVTTSEVVAIPQIPPLEFLQHLPVLGPVLFTPIVAAIHQIPIVSDLLHPLIGYPLRPGQPAPRDVKVISPDGTAIYVHFMPAAGLAPGQTAPTVLNGPGLGMPGATNIDGTILDDILIDALGMIDVGTLRHAGYNVVTWDPRGEYFSGGRLELNGADWEGRDMSAIIDWLATQPEVLLDAPGDPRLGMTGVSYGGGIQLVTAANDHRVDAIVPTITYHSFTTSLYKAEAFKNSWATLLTGVLAVTMARTNPRILPAAVIGALTGTMLPSDRALLESRNPAIENITVPTLLIQGTVDTVFSGLESDATAQILMDNGVPVKVVWFCGGHGVCAHNLFDPTDGQLIKQRTLQWLDRYVKGDPGVATGPQFEWVDQRGQWWASDEYPAKKGTPIVAGGGPATLPLIPYLGGSGIPFVPYALQAPVAVNVRMPAATETTYVVGSPEVTLTYSGVGTSRHVYAQLVDNTTGLVLGSLITPIPVTLDGQTHQVTVSLESVAHTLRPGESVTLQLVASSGTYERILPSVGVLNVHDIEVSLPTADPTAVSAGGVTTVALTVAA